MACVFFRFIIGDSAGALEDLDQSTNLDPKYTQTWVKKASVHMELCSTGQCKSFQPLIGVSVRIS